MNAATAAADAQSSRIEINGVGKRYGDLQVFKDINLEFREREIVTIVGPSGCGKTTLLRCIDGLLPVNEGEIRIEGDLITQPREGVSMVFQHFGLFPWKTVRHNVGYGLKLAGAPRAEIAEKVPYYTDLVGLKGFEDAYPYQLSGGMQQRCGLARALATGPKLLLLDEVMAGLNATEIVDLVAVVRKIRDSGVTIFLIEHVMQAVMSLSDYTYVLNHGAMIAEGQPSQVTKDPNVIEAYLGHGAAKRLLAMEATADA